MSRRRERPRRPERRPTRRAETGGTPSRARPRLPAGALTAANHERERSARLRELVLRLWARTRIDWGFAATRLSATLREERWLGSQERRQVVETLYGMIRQSRRIDFALEAAVRRPPPGTTRELARYLAYRLLAGEIDVATACAELPEVRWETVADVDARIERERRAASRFGLAHSLPDWLAARLLEEYGAEADDLATALNRRAPLTLRVNTARTTREALLARLRTSDVEAAPTRFSPHGIILASRIDVFGLAAYREGLFEVQDEGSQLIAELVAPPPRGIVLDACAGAGGKTLALGAAMASKGRLLAADTDAKKLEELKKRARRAGLSSVQALPTDADTWPYEVGLLLGKLDRILVDAPCTGTGSLRRNPEVRWRLDEDDVASFTATQERLARRSLELLAPGGRLIYATCSLLRAENEAVVERLLAGAPGLELVRAAEIWGHERAAPVTDATGTFLRVLPHRHGTDGFFAAVLRRLGR